MENEISQNLRELHDLIVRAVFPEDLFGSQLLCFEDGSERETETRDEMEEALQNIVREWRAKCLAHSRLSELNEVYAEEAVVMINRLYREAVERIDANEYGEDLKTDFNIVIDGKKIMLRKFLLETDTAEVYTGNVMVNGSYGEKILAKIATLKGNNRFIWNETRALRAIFNPNDASGDDSLTEEDKRKLRHYNPANRTFKTSNDRLGYVTSFRADYYSLREVRESERWKDGVPEKHMVWMFNRLLSAIGLAHSKNIIHCGLNPDSALFRPRDHNMIVANWDYALLNASANNGTKDFARTEDFVAPELLSGEMLIPSSDLYAVGKLMIYILGGNPKTNEMPDSVNPRIQSFIKAFVLESKWQRVNDAWQAHGELYKLMEELWGPRQFIKFAV